MKRFGILTLIWVAVLTLFTLTTSPMANQGFGIIIGWFYITMAYLIALVGLGFWAAVERFSDSVSETPKLDHPGYRGGLVRTNQLPDWMQDGDKTGPSSVPVVNRRDR